MKAVMWERPWFTVRVSLPRSLSRKWEKWQKRGRGRQ